MKTLAKALALALATAFAAFICTANTLDAEVQREKAKIQRELASLQQQAVPKASRSKMSAAKLKWDIISTEVPCKTGCRSKRFEAKLQTLKSKKAAPKHVVIAKPKQKTDYEKAVDDWKTACRTVRLLEDDIERRLISARHEVDPKAKAKKLDDAAKDIEKLRHAETNRDMKKRIVDNWDKSSAKYNYRK